MAGISKKRPIIQFGIMICVLSLLLSMFVLFILFWPQNNFHAITKITVEPGSSLNRITENLYDKEIVSDRKIFSLAVQLLGKEKEIPIGTFTLINANSNLEIINQLVYGAPEVKKVRILEGWNLSQIAIYLHQTMGFDSTQVMQLAKDRKILKKNNINANSLEGYLYPDTYLFFLGDKPKFVLNHLASMHNAFWTKTLKDRATRLNMTEHQIVTLASIIEGEAIYDSERPKISAVYHNRLNKDMKLQADPTIQYIIPDSPRRLLNKDLRIESPYNTYLNKGLPPGPINSPGKKSILAALFPEENDFLYFVAKGDGYHTFTTNENDHNKAKRKLQQIRRELNKNKRK